MLVFVFLLLVLQDRSKHLFDIVFVSIFIYFGSQILQKSSPRRLRCSQDGLNPSKIEPKTAKVQPRWPLGAHMGAKTPPKTAQKHPKRSCFSPFFQVFGAKCPQVRSRTPKTTKFGAKRAPGTPLRPPLDLDFNTILDDFL